MATWGGIWKVFEQNDTSPLEGAAANLIAITIVDRVKNCRLSAELP